MEVTTTFEKTASGIDFATVVKALGGGMHNISSSDLQEGGRLDQWLREHHLDGVPVVYMAVHSMGDREWARKSGPDDSPFFEDNPSDGWYVFTEEAVQYLFCSSATSGSSLEAWEISKKSWKVILRVPIEDGNPYQGAYWKTFHRALGISEEVPKDKEIPI